MDTRLRADAGQLKSLLGQTLEAAARHLSALDSTAPAADRGARQPLLLPQAGNGAERTLALFQERYGQQMSAGTGPRYWGFVTGGTTPAALMGDWLTSAYDINLGDGNNSVAPLVEQEAIDLLRQLFGLPSEFAGVFVSGATLSNFVGLALGREWVGRQHGHNIAENGLTGLPPIRILSSSPHSSILKSLAMLGLGRQSVIRVAMLSGNREALDLAALEEQLRKQEGSPCIVVGNAGTVNTVDFDDLAGIAALREKYAFWLHVDAAFGGFAACSPQYAHLLNGIEHADSLTIDAHKWLNVPYDSAMIFTRHRQLQTAVFQNVASYLPDLGDDPDFFHLTPENSRRFRALPAWFTLVAYGRDCYREIVERNCLSAQSLGRRIEESELFRLLAPARMNVVCFTLTTDSGSPSSERVSQFLRALRDDGRVFLTPTVYQGLPGMRAAFSNWRTDEKDVEIAWAAMTEVGARVLQHR
jgi:glutamate/tyrosine decarboxylase-like PLP-dependent enzyme